ncbi:MAG: hypothetical protein CMM31_08685 [Rhodospirillaceae bacterium]|nr:hypothetical protein [Rhodospirillaceae bacterium]
MFGVAKICLGVAALLFVAFLLVPPALAACTDMPAPGVDWQRCYLDKRHFQNADLSGATLRSSFFAHSDFTGANLTGVDARRAKFVTAILNEVRFDEARLIGADFTTAELAGASFRGADLRRAKFFRADLRGADFTGATLGGTDFLKADLSGATWIDGKTICPEDLIGQCN